MTKFAHLVLGLSLACTAIAANGPFTPYLTRKPPQIIRNLGKERQGNVEIQHFVFFSRTAQTANGSVRSEISALIARPVQSGRYPGILLLHGGAGHAQESIAVDWANRGFVVLAPDLPGIGDAAKKPNAAGAWKGKYGEDHFLVAPDVTSSGIFDGVLAAVQSLYLLRAQPDVNPARVGVTGVSWGGYATITVAGLAHKDVYAAYAIYGSGHFDLGSAFQRDALSKLPLEQSQAWMDQLDARNYTSGITSEFFEAAATNDTFFWVPAVTATLEDIHSHKNLVFAPNADHWMDIPGGCQHEDVQGVPHDNAWMSEQVPYFEYLLKRKGKPFPEVISASEIPAPGGVHQVCFQVRGSVGKTAASVYYSTCGAPWKSRKWVRVTAEQRGKWYRAQIPAKVDWLALATDSRPVTVSTGIHVSEGPVRVVPTDWVGGK